MNREWSTIPNKETNGWFSSAYQLLRFLQLQRLADFYFQYIFLSNLCCHIKYMRISALNLLESFFGFWFGFFYYWAVWVLRKSGKTRLWEIQWHLLIWECNVGQSLIGLTACHWTECGGRSFNKTSDFTYSSECEKGCYSFPGQELWRRKKKNERLFQFVIYVSVFTLRSSLHYCCWWLGENWEVRY